MLVIIFSQRIKESLVPGINNEDFSLDQINNDSQVLEKSSLFDEGRQHMRKLFNYILSTHISSVNLISSICVLSNIAKQRPEYMEIVLETCQKILSNFYFVRTYRNIPLLVSEYASINKYIYATV